MEIKLYNLFTYFLKYSKKDLTISEVQLYNEIKNQMVSAALAGNKDLQEPRKIHAVHSTLLHKTPCAGNSADA